MRLDFDDETVSVGSDEINLFVFLDEMIVVEINECDLTQVEDLCTDLERLV